MKKVLLAAACAALVCGAANAADLTLDILYNGGTQQIEIYAHVTGQTGDELGLALLGVDLECDSAEALAALSPDLTSAVTELDKDAGLTNPGTNAYFGTVSGNNLLQLCGGQNTIGYDGTGGPTYPTGVVNTSLAMTNILVAAYDVNVGGLTGPATYTLNNPFANVIDDAGAGPVYAVSPMASLGYTNQSVIVDPGGAPVAFLGTADSIGTYCNLTLSTGDTEPRSGGIRQLNFLFGGPPSGTPVLSWDNSGSCPPTAPVYVAYSGASVMACSPSGSELQCTFTPALEDDASYAFDLTGISSGGETFEVRSLIGDAFADGIIDGSDRSTVHANWGQTAATACSTDVFEDNSIDGSDRSTVHANWGNCAP
jgi:opacity protein-like surface antigen